MASDIASAYTRLLEVNAAAGELIAQLSDVEPVAISFFASHHHDGAALSARLRQVFPRAAVIGCTTAGELTQEAWLSGSVSALALGRGKVRAAAAALARFDQGVAAGIASAGEQLSTAMALELRQADPCRYVGVVLVEGLRMHEEAANDALGNLAPTVSFVGGSAGDDGEFKRTRVFCNGEESDNGAALLLLDAAVPFVVTKTCSFEPASADFPVTRVDVEKRIVYEIDGRPVLEVYAELVGVAKSALDDRVFMAHPFGLMIDGKPWIRSPQRVLPDGGLKFYCQILEGMRVHVMRSIGLVADTRRELSQVRARLGGSMSGGLAFNCILRRKEIDAMQTQAAFIESFAGLQMAGFHTYGESWLGHINQTFTGLWFA
ncbi:MAG TPA: FIST N-terminal domain-containing protein [Polyangiales bacterium]